MAKPKTRADYRTLRPVQVIVHEIPKDPASAKREKLPLSDAPAPDDRQVLSFFRERITSSIDTHGLVTQFATTTDSPIPGLVTSLLDDADGLVPHSQHAARHLYEQQPGVSPEGLLVVILGTVNGDLPCVTLLKLQKQSGLRVRNRKLAGGGQTLAIEILNELMLTERTKVFKVGVFVKMPDGVIEGRIADEQLGSNASGGVAAFFMRTLGCREAEAPAVLTRRTYETLERFINTKVEDPATIIRYSESLRADIQSHQNTFEPATFIEKYIDPDHRDEVAAYLEKHDVPMQPFVKDPQGIAARLAKRTARTQHNVRITADADTFHDLVEPGEIDGEHVVIVRDRLISG